MAAKVQTEASSRTEITIVLIGTIGSGKSRTGNTIIGSDKFKHRLASIPVTAKMEYSEVDVTDSEYNELHLTVIDIPGLKKFQEFCAFQKEINRQSHGTCVYLFLIRIGRFGSDDKNLLDGFFKSKPDIGFRTGIVLTRSSELTDLTVKQWIMDVETLKNIIDERHVPYIAIDNADDKGNPRHDLINLITKLYNADSPEDTNREITVSYRQMKESFGNAGVQFFNRMYEKSRKSSFCNPFNR